MAGKRETDLPELTTLDNIKVCVRVRPMSLKEQEENPEEFLETQLNQILIKKDAKSQRQFTFDRVFDPSVDQEAIFQRLGQQMVESFLAGFNSTIFTYGQTGAGKTHTMIGSLDRPDDAGLLPRCLEYIFYSLAEQGKEFSLRTTFIEIYNERIIDLLADDDLTPITIREDPKRGVFLDGAREEPVTDTQSALTTLKRGLATRHTSFTNMNKESSRSHCIFTLHCSVISEENQCSSLKTSVFNFIDLAGSERHRDTQTTGDRFKEGCNINKSLTVLGTVINALSDKRSRAAGQKSFVRYRDSKLTHLLKNSLGGNSKTAFIANVSPAARFAAENLSTLMFAQRAKKVQNSAKINELVKGSSLAALTLELNRTKQELYALEEKYGVLEKAQLLTREELTCNKCLNKGLELKQRLAKRSRLLSQVFLILKTVLQQYQADTTGVRYQGRELRFETPAIPACKSYNDFRELPRNLPSCDSVSLTVTKRKGGDVEKNMPSISKPSPGRVQGLRNDLCFSTNGKQNRFPAQLFFTSQKSQFLNHDLLSLVNNKANWEGLGLNNPEEAGDDSRVHKGLLAQLSRQVKLILDVLRIEALSSNKSPHLGSESPEESQNTELARLQAELDFYRSYAEETERNIAVSEAEIVGLGKIIDGLKARTDLQPQHPQVPGMDIEADLAQTLPHQSPATDPDSAKLIEGLRWDLRLAQADSERLRAEHLVLQERNKMLKSWSDQALDLKEKANEELERLKYEKFAMMKKYDEDFEQIREKQQRLFGCWKEAEREKEVLIHDKQSLNAQLKLTQDQNSKLMREIDHHRAVEQTLESQLSEYAAKLNLTVAENKGLATDKAGLEAKLATAAEEAARERKSLEDSLADREVRLTDLTDKNTALLSFSEKTSQECDRLRNEVILAQTEKEKVNQGFDALTRSHQTLYDKLKRTKLAKDALHRRWTEAGEQATLFFNTLLTIRDKLDPKSAPIFEDFMVASQIKSENGVLRKKLDSKDIELGKARADFERFVGENEKSLANVKVGLRVLENKYGQTERGLALKNEELEVYRKELRSVRAQAERLSTLKVDSKEAVEGAQALEKSELQLLRSENAVLKEKLRWLAGTSRADRNQPDDYVIVKSRPEKLETENVAKRIKFI